MDLSGRVADRDFKLENPLRLTWAAAVLAACASCATVPEPAGTGTEPAASAASTASAAAAPSAPVFAPGVELPAGPGREIIDASCLSCHDLTALPLFAPFYTRDTWRTLVVTMQAHGADVDNAEVEVLSDYLAQHFGAKPRTP